MFFGFALRGYGCLKGRPRMVIVVRGWCAFSWSSRCRSPRFQRKDYLSDFDLFALLYPHLFNLACNRGRNFHNCFVCFQLHDRLTGSDLRTRCNQQTHQVSLVDIFSQFWKLEFTRGILRSVFF